MRQNALAYGIDRRHGPVREGPALLQGRVICGICGNRMRVHYHRRGLQLVPDYLCNRNYMEHAAPVCQIIPGANIDAAVGKLLVEAMTPLAIELSLAVQEEIRAQLEEADRLRRQQVERARYEAGSARRRYMHVDPENRLVADTLEAEYNEKLRALAEAQDNYERQCSADRKVFSEAQRTQLFSLIQDFPAIWNDPKTPQRERKRIVALLIEDVTLIKAEKITIQVRFKGGATTTLTTPLPLNAWQGRRTPENLVSLIAELLDSHTDAEAAGRLNERGCVTGAGEKFSKQSVRWIRNSKGLKNYKERLKEKGMLTPDEIAKCCRISYDTVKSWREKGLLIGRKCNDKGDWLYFPPSSENMSIMKKSIRDFSPGGLNEVELPEKEYEV